LGNSLKRCKTDASFDLADSLNPLIAPFRGVGQKHPSFEQEMYLMGSTVGYTVLIGTAIQINRMPQADDKTIVLYWTFLLILGFILWGITISKTTGLAKNKPRFLINPIKYKKRFRQTQIAKEVTSLEQAQAYLKRLK